jgi:NTE family protein
MPRRAIVIGGGGVLGGTWAVGALSALEAELGIAARDVDLLVGTSAGSVLTALVAGGVSTSELRQEYGEEKVTSGPLSGYEWNPIRATGGSRPGLPRILRPGSPKLFGSGLLKLGELPLTAVLSGLLPPGGKSLERVGHLIDAVTPLGEWAPNGAGSGGNSPLAWIVAMDYETGKRVVFGRAGAPHASLSEAVMASCAIPGWFAPVVIGNRTYVDGGAVSATSIDVVSHEGFDEVYVIAPMSMTQSDNPTSLTAKLERAWRGVVARTAAGEIASVVDGGAQVFVSSPTAEDLTAMGTNLMDSTRRKLVLATSLRTSPLTWSTQLV